MHVKCQTQDLAHSRCSIMASDLQREAETQKLPSVTSILEGSVPSTLRLIAGGDAGRVMGQRSSWDPAEQPPAPRPPSPWGRCPENPAFAVHLEEGLQSRGVEGGRAPCDDSLTSGPQALGRRGGRQELASTFLHPGFLSFLLSTLWAV